MKRTGTELKNKMSRQERREARLRQEKLRLQKKSKLTLIVYAVIRLIVVGVLVRSAFNGQIESVYTCLLTLVLLLHSGAEAGGTPPGRFGDHGRRLHLCSGDPR